MRLIRWVFCLSLAGIMIQTCDTDDDQVYNSISGIYTCQETSPHAGLRQYPVEIEKVSDSDKLYIIINFHNKGESEFLFAEETGDALSISNQLISDIRVNGTGAIGKDYRTIELNYLTDDGTTILDFHASYKR